ncbi:hypothetical protein J4227_01425 [Candidatus Woesearchaeota archaeon]|nr:hypothetical protein [Candidatus Woesearchaeota archaeon]
MDEGNLLAMSLVTGILGLAWLYYVSASAEVPSVESGRAESFLGKQITLSGTVINSRETDKTIQYAVKEERYGQAYKVVYFKEGEGSLKMPNGTNIEVKGEMARFGNELEVLAEKIIITGYD